MQNNSQPRSSMIDAIGGELELQIMENARLREQIDMLNTKISVLEQRIQELELKS